MKLIIWCIHLVAYLPLRVLYIVSDLLYVVLYRILRYRVSVVRENLEHAFPEASIETLRTYEKTYYKHLFDLMVETIKEVKISMKELTDRVQVTTAEVFDEIKALEKGAVLVTGHYNNWEWQAKRCALLFGEDTVVAYKPTNNKAFDAHMTAMRKRETPGHVIPLERFLRFVLRERRDKINYFYLIADQTPHKDQIEYTTQFLQQETAVYLGAENIVKLMDLPMYFVGMRKQSRGRYEIFAEKLADGKLNEPKMLTNRHVQALEQLILSDPAYWLWSHRRWKYTRT